MVHLLDQPDVGQGHVMLPVLGPDATPQHLPCVCLGEGDAALDASNLAIFVCFKLLLSVEMNETLNPFRH